MTADSRSVDDFTALLSNFVNSRLLTSLTDLRTSHSHSDLLLPPDFAFPVLSTELKAFAEEHGLKSTPKEVPEGATEEQKAEHERHKKALVWQSGARAWLLMDFVSQRPGSSTHKSAHLDNAEVKSLFDRFDVILAFELEGLVDAQAPLSTIEAVMDSLPLASCAKLLDYIESRKSELLSGATQLSPSRGKGPVMLRIGNELRRRLSKPAMHDTILAGRIAAFLSGAFPLGERSGSNQEGRFNVDNRTIVEDDSRERDDTEPEEKAAKEVKENQEEVDAENADEGESKAEVIEVDAPKTEKSKAQAPKTLTLQQKATPDSRFYALFWSAQQFFANPTLLFEEESVLPADLLEDLEDPAARPDDSGALREFRIATKRIVDLMSAVNEHELSLAGAEQGHSASASGKGGDSNSLQGMETEAESAEKESFFPKYLTGRNILASEVRDPSFRRQVLVQFLILLQYILEFNPKRRPMWEHSKNKALLRPYILAEADVEWCSATWRSILTLLRDIPGPQSYVGATTQALRREHSWTQWKLEMCPPLQKAPMSAADATPHAEGIKRLRKNLPVYPHKLGTFALKQLWEDGVPPPQPGKRKRENDEGIEVEVDTDGLEELEFPPVALDFDAYTRKWRKLEAQADARRAEIGLLKGTERREKELRATMEVLTMKGQRSQVINLKTQIVMVDHEMASLKNSAPPNEDEDAEAKAKENYESKMKELQARKEDLINQLPSESLKKKNNDILVAASVDLERYATAVKTEKADEKLSALVEQEYCHSWRALRLASREHLGHLARIPADDLDLLIRTLNEEFDPRSLTVEAPKEEGLNGGSPSMKPKESPQGAETPQQEEKPNGRADGPDAVMTDA